MSIYILPIDTTGVISGALSNQPVPLPALPDALVTDAGGTIAGNCRFSLTNGGAALPYGVENETDKIVHVNMTSVTVGAQNIYAWAEATAENKAGVPSADAEAYRAMAAAASVRALADNAPELDIDWQEACDGS